MDSASVSEAGDVGSIPAGSTKFWASHASLPGRLQIAAGLLHDWGAGIGRCMIVIARTLLVWAIAASASVLKADEPAAGGAAKKPADLVSFEAPTPKILPRTVFPRIELADGRVLENARANAEDASTVTFLHRSGISKIDKRLLPEDIAAVFPFDSAAAAEQAEAAAAQRDQSRARQAEREDELRRREARRQEAQLAVAERQADAKPSAPPAASPAEIEEVAAARARQYFEDEKRTGSGQTLVFGVKLRLEEPVEIAGWTNRWRVDGEASYKVYDSIGWGSFSSRSRRRFDVTVEAVPGKRPKVIDFTER